MTVASTSSTPQDSLVRAVANIFISFIGAGVLGLPYAFKIAGLLEGTIIMTAVCYLSVKAMLLLIDCKYRVEDIVQHRNGKPPGLKKTSKPKAKTKAKIANGKEYVELKDLDTVESMKIGEDKPVTYSDVAFAAFGPTGRLIIDASLLVSQVGFCCAYIIFISENLASFVHGLTQHQWLIVILPPLFFLTLIPDLNNLAIFSLLAQISNLFAFAVVFWFDFDHLHLASPEHRKEFSITGFPFFFSVAIYCFEGAGMILSLEASVSDRMRPMFKKLFVWTIVSVTALYIAFGVSGYLSYGEATKDIITLNLESGKGIDFAILVKACLCFSLFFTYPIMLFPVTSLLQERMLTPSQDVSGGLYHNLIRFALVTSTGMIVVLVPRFADLMALVGATCCTLLGFIMPGMCHLVICKKRSVNINPTLNYVLVITGVIGAVLGTFDAIKTILRTD